MNRSLAIIFFEDYFVCSILPNESAWEVLTIGGTERPWLYFFVGGGDVRNDDFAKERYEAKDGTAFGDFYALIRDKERTFRRFDLDLPPIQLLHDVSQQVKAAYFSRMKAFDQYLSDDAAIPLHVCFIPGVHPDAQDALRTFFTGDGYTIHNSTDYHAAFVRSLQRKAVIPTKVNMAIIEPTFGDMRFHYLECDGDILKRSTEVLSGKGVDYRIGNLAKLLVEKAALRSHSPIMLDQASLEQEIKRFHKVAAVEIDRFEYDQVDVMVELIDFCKARVVIDRQELDRMSAASLPFIKFRFESFVSKTSTMMRTEKIVLNGAAVDSSDFVTFFRDAYGPKLIQPFANFIELMSRGVFALAEHNGASIEEQVEIKITVTTKPAAGGESATREVRVNPPPLPPRPPARPSLPPFPGSTTGRSAPAGGGASLAGKPPIPPMRTPPPSAAGTGVPVRPPLPPATRPPAPKEHEAKPPVGSRPGLREIGAPKTSVHTPAPPPLPGKGSSKVAVTPNRPADTSDQPVSQPVPPKQQSARPSVPRASSKKNKGSK